ncbi:ATP-binding protein [Streptomyces mexicanus]|uniref:ATP-binding protein n=1 Tax=Streptomyces mexicanus TaxID=178566 RepID=A0A7X1I7G6_9ACTN|nr:ATP-binding protein [Streptomyces mexicanus]MBC2867913.1 ATP-binding protein [Streptomyces mexicanus]
MNHVTGPQTGDVQPGYRAEFALGGHSVRHLRRILRLYLERSGLLDVADAAELALSELLTNVVRHVPGRRCGIYFLLLPGAVRVEVSDRCARLPVPGGGEPLAEGGRGLLLVAAVTDRWGVTPHPGGSGKTVWFECVAGGAVTPDGQVGERGQG